MENPRPRRERRRRGRRRLRQAAASSVPESRQRPAPPPAAAEARSPADEPGADVAQGAVAGFLVNGSVNNGAASPFAQLAAFGNNRRGVRSLYNFGVGDDPGQFGVGFAAVLVLRPAHGETRLQRRADRGHIRRTAEDSPDPSERSECHRQLPADLGPHGQHRAGADADRPRTRRRFLADARRIRAAGPDRRSVDRHAVRRQRHSRRSHQSAGRGASPLLPTPESRRRRRLQLSDAARHRRQAGQHPAADDAARLRPQPVVRHVRLSANDDRHHQRVRVRRLDRRRQASTPAINCSRRFSQFVSLRLRYQFTRLATETTPYFANRTNVSGDAGIAGNNQDPANWGPPTLSFSSGVQALTDGQYASNRNLTNAFNAEIFWSRGRHAITFGGDIPPAAVQRAVAAGRARRVHVHRQRHRLRSRGLPARQSAGQRRSRSATPTSTCARRPPMPTSTTTGD